MTKTAEVALTVRCLLGLGFFSTVFMSNGINALAIPLYQMTLHIDPVALGFAITAPKLFSVTFSLLAGHVSDRLHSRWGRRRPFVFINAWTSGICFGLLWMVNPEWSHTAQLWYLAVVSLLYYSQVEFYSVALESMTCEVGESDQQRTRIFAFVTYCNKLGGIMHQWIFPLATVAAFGGVVAGVQFIGWVVGLGIMGFLGCLPAIFLRCSDKMQKQRPPKQSMIKGLQKVFSNQSMIYIITLVFCINGVVAFAVKMDFYLLVYYVTGGDLKEGAIWKSILSSAYAICAIVYVPTLVALADRLGTLGALKVIYVISLIGGIAKWFLYVPGIGFWILIEPILCAGTWTSIGVLVRSLVASISAKESEKSQNASAGSFISGFGAVQTLMMFASTMLGAAALNWVGFDAELLGDQTEQSLEWMRVLLAGGTVAGCGLALLLCCTVLRGRV